MEQKDNGEIIFSSIKGGKGENYSVYFSKVYNEVLKNIANENDITVTKVVTTIVTQYIDQYHLDKE